jgi:hypothetical protein
MNQGTVKKFFYDRFVCLSIENTLIRADFLPELGGKMIRLEEKTSGHQWLLPPQSKGGLYRRASLGDNFEEYDTSGFDECFPTVEQCQIASLNNGNGKNTMELPDHGEIWSRTWEYSLGGNELHLSIRGAGAKYLFSKIISLDENRIDLKYRVENLSDADIPYLWSAHPLLDVVPGSQIIVPDAVHRLLLNWSSDTSIGKFGDMIGWPRISSERGMVDYSIVQQKIFGRALKGFTDPLEEGYAGLFDVKNNQSILFEFDPKEIPYLGLWLCYGGWPTAVGTKHLTVALEPCNGRPDSLSEAIVRGEYGVVRANAANEWNLDISLWTGFPKPTKTIHSHSQTYSL